MYNIDYQLISHCFYLLLIISISLKMAKHCGRNMSEQCSITNKNFVEKIGNKFCTSN